MTTKDFEQTLSLMTHSVASFSNAPSITRRGEELGSLCGSQRLFRDRYKVCRVLGRGGFGVTFLARDMRLPGQPSCVIKQLCPKVDSPDFFERAQARFEREAKILGQLGSHAQIPTLLDYFSDDNQFFLVQEYVKGSTLGRIAQRSGPLTEAAVKQFIRQILPILKYVHGRNVIHRDIKPANIIRCKEDGRLVLIDFGAVKEQIAPTSSYTSQKTPTTHFVGTMGFAAPEQLALRPGYASDIYAIGVTCLYFLTGRAPLEFDYEPISGEIDWQHDVQLSEHFSNVLSKMLKADPRERYQSVEDVQRALDLESHFDDLATCLNSRPSTSAGPSANPSGYQSPLQRRASRIRDRRNRQQKWERQNYAARRNFHNPL